MFSATMQIGVKLLRMSKSILKKIGSVTVELTLMVMTWPSGGDFATASSPMAPPAPPLFSTRNGWFHFAAMRGASVRAIKSGVVAAVWPSTKRIGRLEMPWAPAGEMRAKGDTRAASIMRRRRVFMRSSFVVQRRRPAKARAQSRNSHNQTGSPLSRGRQD